MSAHSPVPAYLDLLGRPFSRGGRGPDAYDCYGLVREMFARAGVDVPDFRSPDTLEGTDALIGRASKRWHRVPYGTVNSLVTLRVEGLQAHVGYVIGRDSYLHTLESTGACVERLTNASISPIGFYTYG